MHDAPEDRIRAADLPEGDVIRILLDQHERIRKLFRDVSTAEGAHRSQAFDRLRALLAVHETAEEMVLRPVTSKVAGDSVARARNHEESEANKVLAELERSDVASPEFLVRLAGFETSVTEHADAEEREEFPHILSACDEARRQAMGRMLRAAEAVAPTHPHPSVAGSPAAQWAVGPFASLVDRARDAIRAVRG